MKARTAGVRMTVGALAVAIALVAGSAGAQSVPDEPSGIDSPLNLPSSLTMFGKSDPNIHKATAIVNGAIITDTDIDQRLALVIAANGGNVQGEERERLRLQVLRNLIDETLQIQEAKAQDITIPQSDIDQTFDRVAGQFKKSPTDFATYLRSVGSSPQSMKRQIEGELAWQRVLRRKVEPFVSVGDDEVKTVIDKLKASKGQHEYRIGEIFLSATPDTQAQVLANANRIVDQIKQGGSFVAYARQYSEASTAAVGGDLGWVRAGQLPDPLANAVKQMQTGQISAPIPVGGGFSIIALLDERQVLTADPRDAVLSLKQLAITFPPGTTQAQASPKVAQLAEAAKSIHGCGGANAVAQKVGAAEVENDDVRVRDLPPQLQDLMVKMSIGEATPPFGSLADGVRVLVLCGRDDPQVASGPSYDQIYQQMEQDRVNRRAQAYLRDLRRDAVIDYR